MTAPSMTEVFEALNSANVSYAVIQGYLNLPNQEPSRVSILLGCTTDRAARVMGAVRHEDYPKGHMFKVPGLKTDFYLMEKSGSFFPEPFESQVLQRRQQVNKVYRACFHDVMYARLYWQYYREDGWKNDKEMREVVGMMLDNLVGGRVPPPDFWDDGLKNRQLLPSE